MKKKVICILAALLFLHLYAEEAVNNFAHGLRLIYEDARLLHEKLLEERTKKFESEFEKLIKNHGKHQAILTSDKSIYQIQAPNQEKLVGCGFLTFRNAYTILNALENDTFISFIKYYRTQKNPQEFCGVHYKGGVTFSDMRKATLSEEFKKVNDKIVYFYSSDPRVVLDPSAGKKDIKTDEYKKIIQDLNNSIMKQEKKGMHLDELAIRAALIHASDSNDYKGYEELKHHIKKLHETENYFFGIVTTAKTISAHAILLIIHKNRGILRYYFIDPANIFFTKEKSTTAGNYSTSINRLKIFIEQPEQLDNAIVRYLRSKFTSDTAFKEAIKKLELESNELYKKFYS